MVVRHEEYLIRDSLFVFIYLGVRNRRTVFTKPIDLTDETQVSRRSELIESYTTQGFGTTPGLL